MCSKVSLSTYQQMFPVFACMDKGSLMAVVFVGRNSTFFVSYPPSVTT